MSIAHAAAILFAILPTRGYFRPSHAVNVRFVTGTTLLDQKAVRAGFRAANLLGKFSSPPAHAIIRANGQPVFHIYTIGGKRLTARPLHGTLLDGNVVNISHCFPQVKKSGTYIITWQTANPVVLETLNNPGFSPADFRHIPAQQWSSLPADQKKLIRMQFQPCVYHLVPLQYAQIETAQGTISLKFWYSAAPHTVSNFIHLAQEQFYNGSNFHRIIKGFMIQGGDSLSNVAGRAGTGGPGYAIVQEFNSRPMNRGVIAMARARSVDSAGSQFFIMQKDTPSLDGHYTGFGRVIKGLHVVDKIADTPVRGPNGTVVGPKPKIISVRILPAKASLYGIAGQR